MMDECPQTGVVKEQLSKLFWPVSQQMLMQHGLSLEQVDAIRSADQVQVCPGVSSSDIQAACVTLETLRDHFPNTCIWLAPQVVMMHTPLSCVDKQLEAAMNSIFEWSLDMTVDDEMSWRIHAPSAAHVTAPCEQSFLCKLLALSQPAFVSMRGSPLPLTCDALIAVFSIESLKTVQLHSTVLTADQCRALATVSRDDLAIKLHCCSLDGSDDPATPAAFIDCMQSGKKGGPTELYWCHLENSVLAACLENNSRLQRLVLPGATLEQLADIDTLFEALATNKGLQDLDLHLLGGLSDENWMTLCKALHKHPTLTKLDLRRTLPRYVNQMHLLGGAAVVVPRSMSEQQTRARTLAVVDMMQENTVLRTLLLPDNGYNDEMYQQQILPCVQANRFRPRVKAVCKIRSESSRKQVLGKAATAVRENPSLLWMFLSGNVDAVFTGKEGACKRKR